MDNKTLEKENKELKRKLQNIKKWLDKQIWKKLEIIRKNKIFKNTINNKENFIIKNIEDIIKKQINTFFSDILAINIPNKVVENIINSEVNYYNLKKWQKIDGLSIIIWYHKVIDLLVEDFITKEYRYFVNKYNKNIKIINNPLEKSLNLVVKKWYSLSIGRLYNLIDNINSKDNLKWYTKIFANFLEEYNYLKKILLEKDFILKLKKIVDSWWLWIKRHSWNISNEETKKLRKLIIWDFKDKNCIIYKLLETQKLPV